MEGLPRTCPVYSRTQDYDIVFAVQPQRTVRYYLAISDFSIISTVSPTKTVACYSNKVEEFTLQPPIPSVSIESVVVRCTTKTIYRPQSSIYIPSCSVFRDQIIVLKPLPMINISFLGYRRDQMKVEKLPVLQKTKSSSRRVIEKPEKQSKSVALADLLSRDSNRSKKVSAEDRKISDSIMEILSPIKGFKANFESEFIH